MIFEAGPVPGRSTAHWSAPAPGMQALRWVAKAAAAHLAPDVVVIDVCSVKVRPLAIPREELPAGTRLVGTHPLFGPKSGQDGIAGQKIVVCGEGRDAALVGLFLAGRLRLDLRRATPEAHDREITYVQGLSHLIARSLIALGLPDSALETEAFSRLGGLMDLVGGDPFAPEPLGRSVDAARALAEGAAGTAISGGDG